MQYTEQQLEELQDQLEKICIKILKHNYIDSSIQSKEGLYRIEVIHICDEEYLTMRTDYYCTIPRLSKLIPGKIAGSIMYYRLTK